MDLGDSYNLAQGGTFAVKYSAPAWALIAEADWVDVDLDTALSVEIDAYFYDNIIYP